MSVPRLIKWFTDLAETMEQVAKDKGYKLGDGTTRVQVLTDRDVRHGRQSVSLSIPDQMMPYLAQMDFIASKGVKRDEGSV